MTADSGDHNCDRFAHDDAAYLLGALEPGDRQAFENHLRGCAACGARVDGLRETVALLGALSVEEAAELHEATSAAEPLPATLLPELAQRLVRHRRRQRTLTTALGTVAAVAAAALIGVAFAVRPQHAAPRPAAQAMAVVDASTPVRATAALTRELWGTRILLDCDYPAAPAYPGTANTYTLRVVDDRGGVHDLGSWTLQAGRTAEFVSGTALSEAHIRAVLITLRDGTPVLRLAV